MRGERELVGGDLLPLLDDDDHADAVGDGELVGGGVLPLLADDDGADAGGPRAHHHHQ